MKTKSFKQKVTIAGASPKEIYEALMDSKMHTAITGGAAKISKKVGGAFSAYDGYAIGKNLELIEGKKIVQTWRPVDSTWPEDHDSEIIFELKKSVKGTEISFTHKNVPVERVDEFKKGWIDFYWQPLKVYFGK